MDRLYKLGGRAGLKLLVFLLLALTTAAAADSAFDIPGWDDSSDRVLKFALQDNATSPAERAVSANAPPRFVLIIEVTKALHITTPRYMSVTISGGQLSRGLEGFDFKLPRLRNLAAGLSPSYVRFGGTLADFLDFDPDSVESSDRFNSFPFVTRDVEGELEKNADLEDDIEKELDLDEVPRDLFGLDISARRAKNLSKKKKFRTFTISGLRWDNITRFCDFAGWDIMWDFNLLHFKKGRWDPKYAKKFLKYSASRGVKIPSFQLGNEPNLYKTKMQLDIDGKRLAEDFWTLRDLISEMPLYSDSGIYGPDVTNLDNHKSSRTYLQHYYLKGEIAKLKDFVDPRVMDGLKTQLDYAYDIAWENCRVRKPIRLTETSTATGGGVEGVTNAYVAGFLWLDKLGLAATYRVTHVFRQTFFASSYALISRDLEPNPDYYLSVMYKRLVEGPVFKVITEGLSPLVRVYAHCVSKRYYKYPDGALVVYYLNMAKEQTLLSAGQLLGSGMNGGAKLDLFVFTPGDSDGLLSRKVKLNGKVLEMNGSNLPRMDAQMHGGDVPLTPESYGFVVIPYADVPLCKHYHRTENF
ncbi:heparanase [Elysia marginata]|uniref:Heparanase n=1 Tax=Elysia marginata TaxID=1093978 RepID=A0AAV4EHY2_9GAST|nr:heparanase [Elysia marginata]